MNQAKIILIFLCLWWGACQSPKNKEIKNNKTSHSLKTHNPLKVQILKIALKGDFNGDGQLDTLNKRIFSMRQNKELDSFPVFSEYYELYPWLTEEEVVIYLTSQNIYTDTIISKGLGLFSLINLGDLNYDGGDEIAVTIENADFSNINSCKIYSFCKGKWQEIFSITINESVFWHEENEVFNIENNIPGFLEKINGKWMYYDLKYNEYALPDSTSIKKMKPLPTKNYCG